MLAKAKISFSNGFKKTILKTVSTSLCPFIISIALSCLKYCALKANCIFLNIFGTKIFGGFFCPKKVKRYFKVWPRYSYFCCLNQNWSFYCKTGHQFLCTRIRFQCLASNMAAASRIERDFETFHPATDFQNPDSNLNENCTFWARKIKKVQVKKLKVKIF